MKPRLAQGKRTWWMLTVAVLALGGIMAIGVFLIRDGLPGVSNTSRSLTGAGQISALDRNPNLDPGTEVSGQAPDFTLRNQFGQPVSLGSFRGRVVLLAFIDAKCTTFCPLTTEAMVEAKSLLGASANQVQLLGIDANPTAAAVANVRAYSSAHQMLHQWEFLTGPLPQLERVWKAYHIYVQIVHGLIDHTPGLYAITPGGQLAKVYMTAMAYSGIDQQAEVLAQEASSLLPGHPELRSRRSYNRLPLIYPHTRAVLPDADGAQVRLGPGEPRLLVFFATWLSETSNLPVRLETLDRYHALAAADGLPRLIAIDEGSVEPSSSALPHLLKNLQRPLSYPVAIDENGRLADGYSVFDQPWYSLTSRTGHLVWAHDGWLSIAALVRDVRRALAKS